MTNVENNYVEAAAAMLLVRDGHGFVMGNEVGDNVIHTS
jgi:hypothetical protein